MPHEAFIDWEPGNPAMRELLDNALTVLEEYARLGYAITLRQLYYQLVSRDLLPNEQREYKRLGTLLTKAREAGYVDWDAIVDRGRSVVRPAEWADTGEILTGAAQQFRLDRWQGQPYYVEVWCEKDALSSVIEPVARRYHVRFMANRGYSSATAMYDAAKRVEEAAEEGKHPVVIYLGDHDPSGIDMSRDIEDRLLKLSWYTRMSNDRLALNFDQVAQYRLPPNPAKLTDSRATGYIAAFGMESWELDALDPQTLDGMIAGAIEKYLDRDRYNRMVSQETDAKRLLREFAQHHNGCTCKNPYCPKRTKK